jgi:hypothetical protein
LIGLLTVASSCYRSKLSDVFNVTSKRDPQHPKAPRRLALCGSLACGPYLMAGQRSKMQEDVRFRVLRLLQENPEMSQRELAAEVGISVGGTHYVLNALIEKGLIKLGNV